MEEQYDNILLGMAQKHAGGMPDVSFFFLLPLFYKAHFFAQFLRTFAGFLRRRSDFYTGDWEPLIMEILRKEANIAMAEHKVKIEKEEKVRKAREEKELQERIKREKDLEENKICDITEEEAAEIIKEEEAR